MRLFLSVILTLCIASFANAGEADVINVDVKGSGNQFTFSVTVRHDDEGWDHYADRWDVVGQDGTIYGQRVLAHPHVDEQPFTRSGTFTIPSGVSVVVVRAHDSVHGLGGQEVIVTLPGINTF